MRPKPALAAGLLRLPHQRRADAAARVRGVNEEGADPRRVERRVERGVDVGVWPRAAPKSVLRRLHPPHPVSAASSAATKYVPVGQELGIDCKHRSQGRIDLLRRVVGQEERACRDRDQGLDCCDFVEACKTKIDAHREGAGLMSSRGDRRRSFGRGRAAMRNEAHAKMPCEPASAVGHDLVVFQRNAGRSSGPSTRIHGLVVTDGPSHSERALSRRRA